MRGGLVAVVALAAFGVVHGGDCPTPKRLTCAELKERVADRCPPEPVVERRVEVPVVVTKEVQVPVQVPGPERVVIQTEVVEVPAPSKGRALLGLGPVYSGALGATALGGYRFPGGRWELLGGPMWIPRDGREEIHGVAVKGCVRIPYTVPAGHDPSPWGAQVLAVYAFGK